jgi:hypothetical protein
MPMTDEEWIARNEAAGRELLALDPETASEWLLKLERFVKATKEQRDAGADLAEIIADDARG